MIKEALIDFLENERFINISANNEEVEVFRQDGNVLIVIKDTVIDLYSASSYGLCRSRYQIEYCDPGFFDKLAGLLR